MCQKLAQWKTSDIHTNELGTSIHGVVLKPNPNSQFPELPELSAGPAGDYAFLREWKWDLKDVHVAMAVTLCTGLITSLMVYGAVRGCPSCLMPFFCLQVFDFMISALSVIGYFSYMPNPREIIQNSHDIPFQKELMQLDAQWLCAIVMAAFIVCMLVKAYFMGVVWSCYKYLKLLQMTQIVDNYLDLEEEMLLPTDSEMGVKSPLYLSPYGHPPPPPYTPPTNNEV
ncbi:lysosomal-associated transmembrane protein 4A-like isoform X1 [Tachypleus tridentatus]|uniref:lysosomal-associated transmembrane protein 4A-like isoform X1 n=1 Tax=Tachypleus tridentatus TaxID=6853 RepID=UPI003FD02731